MKLSRRYLLLIGLIAISFGIFGEEPEAALTDPMLRFIGRIQNFDEPENIRIIHDGEGSCYILAIIKGELAVWKTNPEGITNPYPLPGLDNRLTNIRSAEFFGYGFPQYVAYRGVAIAGADVTETISIIGLDDSGALRLFPVTELRVSGVINSFSILPGLDGNGTAFILNQGKLTRVSGIGFSGQTRGVQLINREYTKVIAFEALSDLGNNYQGGWYKTGDHEFGEIEFFIIDEEGWILRENLGMFPEDAIVHLGMTFDGDITCSIVHKNRVVFVEVKEGVILPPAIFDLPFPTLQYYRFPGEAGGLAVSREGPTSAIYGLRSGMGESFLPEPWTGLGGMDALGDLIFLDEDIIGAIYLQEGLWHIAKGDFKGSFIEDKAFRDLPEDSSFYFADYFEGCKIYFRTPSGSIVPYDYQNGIWIREKTIHLPDEVILGGVNWDDNPMENSFYRYNRIIPVRTSSGLFLLGLGGEESFFIPGTRLAWSININGKTYAASYADGSLSLYLMEE